MENDRLSDQNLRRNEHDSNGNAIGEDKLAANGGTIRQAVTNVADLSRVTDAGFMFYGVYSFNGNLPTDSWDVSSATSMIDMYLDASSFEQKIGYWHIVLNDASIDYGDAPGAVGRISAQNAFLDRQNPVYGLGSGGHSGSFELNDANLVMKEVPTRDSYTVTITATSTETLAPATPGRLRSS